MKRQMEAAHPARGGPARAERARTPRAPKPKTGERAIGASVPRKDGLEQVESSARYIDYIAIPGMLHAAGATSAHPHPDASRLVSAGFSPPALWMPAGTGPCAKCVKKKNAHSTRRLSARFHVVAGTGLEPATFGL